MSTINLLSYYLIEYKSNSITIDGLDYDKIIYNALIKRIHDFLVKKLGSIT